MNNHNIINLTDAQSAVYNDIIEYFDFYVKYVKNNKEEPNKDKLNKEQTDNNKIKDDKTKDDKTKKKTKDVKINNEIVKKILNNEYLLVGYAGTGKTTLMAKLIKDSIKEKRCKTVAVAAPTHKAVNIAKSKLFGLMGDDESLTKNINIMTIHRLLNYQSVVNSEGEKVFEKSKVDPIWNMYDLVVIDECSMLSDQIINDIDTILKDKKNKNVKVLYVGDSAQLPPVNQKNSRIFTKPIRSNVLHNIIRTNNTKIMELSNDHRKWIKDQRDVNIPQIGKYIHDKIKAFRKIHSKFWLNDYIKNFKNSGEDTGYNNSIILTWTNRKCNEYNGYVRKTIFNKENLDYYEVGEILILNDFHRIIDEDANNTEEDKENNIKDTKDEKKYINFYTSEQIKITKIKKCNYNFGEIKVKSSSNLLLKINETIKTKVKEINKLLKEDVQVFKLTINKISELNDPEIKARKYKIYTIHKDSQAVYERMLNQIDVIINEIKEKTIGDILPKNNQDNKKDKKNKMSNMEICGLYSEVDKKINKIYRDILNNVIDCFAKLNYGYCITVHKSQGSTFENVYIDIDDILNNNNEEETMKCIYTAITRTSNTLQFLMNG